MKPRSCVVVFAKSPRLGAVKTRFTPPLSARQALELHRACLLGTLRVVLSLPSTIEKALYWSGKESFHLPRGWRPKLVVRRQRGMDLGARMSNAIAELLERGYERVMIIGSDHPTLARARLLEALRRLERAEVALGPSLDGGYYLVACRRWIPAMFQEISWGTSRVFRSTRARLARLGVRLSILEPWYDVDRPSDLARARRNLARRPKDRTYPIELTGFLSRVGKGIS